MLDRLSLFDLVGRKLDYTTQRHTTLARNVANADTPGFVPHDVVEPDFARAMSGLGAPATLGLTSTHPGHQSGLDGIGPRFRGEDTPAEIKPSGNAVSLDLEAGKLRSNYGQYRFATQIYGKYLTMLRNAVGQNG